nr:transposase [Sedimentibacter sp.]
MPRQARLKSITGIYHIMLRGIDKRDIFLDSEDKLKFLESIERAKEKGNFKVLGYCLMDNHIHMLLKEDEEIGTSIKRITVSYVGWHNKKHDRTGHLFQNRYKSEPVETEKYLLTVLRYIHQNPVKAKIAANAEDYNWSSYGHYYSYYNGQKTIIDGTILKSYFSTFEEFSRYMNMSNDDECLETIVVRNNSDDDLIKMIHSKYKVINLPKLPLNEKKEIIRDIYRRENTSIRQLSRIFDMGKTSIENTVKKDS